MDGATGRDPGPSPAGRSGRPGPSDSRNAARPIVLRTRTHSPRVRPRSRIPARQRRQPASASCRRRQPSSATPRTVTDGKRVHAAPMLTRPPPVTVSTARTREATIAVETSRSGHPRGGPAARSARTQAIARMASPRASRPGKSVVSETARIGTMSVSQVALVVRYVSTLAERSSASAGSRSSPSSRRVTKNGQATGASAAARTTPPTPAASSAVGRQPDHRRSA